MASAHRRVKTAVCAFGGNPNPVLQRTDRDTIFRPKSNGFGGWTQPARHAYDTRALSNTYALQNERVSWEIEQHSPVLDAGGVKRQAVDTLPLQRNNKHKKEGIGSAPRQNDKKKRPQLNDEGWAQDPLGSENDSDEKGSSDDDRVGSLKETKMRYRCTRCGEPKHNHVCKYQESIQRSIGAMVYPAVNAFRAKEPGVITPALSEMNNFVSYDSPESDDSPIMSESPPASSPKSNVQPPAHAKKVSPNGSDASSPLKQDAPSDKKGPFVESTVLRPEQFRAVSVAVPASENGAFKFLSVPLSFPERKRLSDTLFMLSQRIDQATEEIAGILNDARERDLWDVAVAELLTQMVVALYCKEGDQMLEGLKEYLLRRGISC